MMFRVVSQMAALTKGSKVRRVVVCRVVVKMSYCKNYVIPFFAVEHRQPIEHATELAMIVGAVKNLLTYLFPVFGV